MYEDGARVEAGVLVCRPARCSVELASSGHANPVKRVPVAIFGKTPEHLLHRVACAQRCVDPRAHNTKQLSALGKLTLHVVEADSGAI
jgi:hypothetical protein